MAKRKGSLSTVVALMGEASQKKAMQQASLFHVERIKPDPLQPRKLLTPQLLAAVMSGEMSPSDGLSNWIEGGAAAQKIKELRRLASTIEQHGLINPITIRPNPNVPNSFLIVTGERRFWSHILLGIEGRTVGQGKTSHKPDQIAATVVDEGTSIRAHQLIENLVREDINVVEKAQGLWALRYELSDVEYDAYRRHSQKGAKLVPWKAVEASAGISRQYRGRIVSVLQLSDSAQALIEQHDFAEATIRPIVEKLRDHPALQARALKQLASWQAQDDENRQIVPSMRNYVSRLLETTQGSATAKPHSKRQPTITTIRRNFSTALNTVTRLEPEQMSVLTNSFETDEDKQKFIGDLAQLREGIDNLLNQLG